MKCYALIPRSQKDFHLSTCRIDDINIGELVYSCPFNCGIGENLSEDAFVLHVESEHNQSKKISICCPICVKQKAVKEGEVTQDFFSHLELHKYRIQLRKKRLLN